MTIVSVDLAYRALADIGIAVMTADGASIACEFAKLTGERAPEPQDLARELVALCGRVGARFLLIDGPQGWKAPTSEPKHARACEVAFNTPGKTGLPGVTKPANYRRFIEFSIEVFDALHQRGWPRYDPGRQGTLHTTAGVAVESFPLSAWRSLGLPILPAKRRAKPQDLTDRLADIQHLFGPIALSSQPNHDELQALVAGLAGLALESAEPARYRAEGSPPFPLDGTWREGLIVTPRRPQAPPNETERSALP